MKTLKLIPTVLFFLCAFLSFAQEEIAMNSSEVKSASVSNSESLSGSEVQANKPELNMYISDNNNVYFPKSMPVYLWVSSSSDVNSPKHLLINHDGSDHFHLDTEGKNTVRSPWAVDPSTGNYKSPIEDVIFDVYADGIAPVTESVFSSAPKYYKEGKVYYGKGLEINLNSNDAISGVDMTFFSINGSKYNQYKGSISAGTEYENKVLYYSVDKVGNSEEPTTKEFYIDVTPPVTTFSITGNVSETVLSPNTKIVLSSTDNLSGVKEIKYSIGNGKETKYTEPIALASLSDGEAEIFYYATDNVNNTEDKRSTSENKSGSENQRGALSLYIDRIAPEVELDLIGDKFTSNYTFISERTQVKLTASDNKAGIEKITYGINTPSRSLDYSEPFQVTGNAGIQSVNYAAVDKVMNWTPRLTKDVYLDKTAPKSQISFIGHKFINRDTLFITKDTKIKISSFEVESGLQHISYSLNDKENVTYNNPITCEQDGFHSIKYFATDNVNNKELLNIKEFVIDNSAPEIKYNFSVQSIGRKTIDGVDYEIYPSNTILYLAATDNAAGVRTIQYSINGGEKQIRTQIGAFKPGQFDVEISANDVLNNESKELIHFIIQN